MAPHPAAPLRFLSLNADSNHNLGLGKGEQDLRGILLAQFLLQYDLVCLMECKWQEQNVLPYLQRGLPLDSELKASLQPWRCVSQTTAMPSKTCILYNSDRLQLLEDIDVPAEFGRLLGELGSVGNGLPADSLEDRRRSKELLNRWGIGAWAIWPSGTDCGYYHDVGLHALECLLPAVHRDTCSSDAVPMSFTGSDTWLQQHQPGWQNTHDSIAQQWVCMHRCQSAVPNTVGHDITYATAESLSRHPQTAALLPGAVPICCKTRRRLTPASWRCLSTATTAASATTKNASCSACLRASHQPLQPPGTCRWCSAATSTCTSEPSLQTSSPP